MKIASIFAAMPGKHSGLMEIKKIVTEILTELGIVPEDINLGYRSLPYYDGIKSEYMSTIYECLLDSDGIIFYAAASFGLPGALLQTLIEHFNFPAYHGIMNNKNCFIVMNSNDSSGAYAMSSMELALQSMGAFSQTRLLIDKNFTINLLQGDKRYIMVERLCEDYYRVLRQQRTVYRPQIALPEFASSAEKGGFIESAPTSRGRNGEVATTNTSHNHEATMPNTSHFGEAIPPSRGLQNNVLSPNKINFNELAMPSQTIAPPDQQSFKQHINSLKLDNINEIQQKDIEEITNFFSNKLMNYEPAQSGYNQNTNQSRNVQNPAPAVFNQNPAPVGFNQNPEYDGFAEKPIIEAEGPKMSVLAQRTSALTHYFRASHSEGLKAGIALIINGAEGFEGYISINSPDCDFALGQLKDPDVTIITEDVKWADIIKGKTSAQKAFMIGQIKVRGNFVLLSKFDQLFDFDKNMY